MHKLFAATVCIAFILVVSSCTGDSSSPTVQPLPTVTSTPSAPPPVVTSTATIDHANLVTLSVFIEPPDSGSVEVQRFGLFTTESLLRLQQGEPVNLIARPNRGWRFHQMRGALSGDDSSQPLVMDASKQVTAVFERTQTSTTAPGEITVVGAVARPARHNVIDLDGNDNLEKFGIDENLAGLYLSMDLDRLGDFLQLFSDGTFYLEEYGVGYSGRWEFSGNEIVLEIQEENP